MTINFNKENGKLDIALDGRLDTNTAPELDAVILEQYAEGEMLTVDCEKLAYISSAGLRVLLSAQKKAQGKMKLKNVCELVMEVFEMTGFADILDIE